MVIGEQEEPEDVMEALSIASRQSKPSTSVLFWKRYFPREARIEVLTTSCLFFLSFNFLLDWFLGVIGLVAWSASCPLQYSTLPWSDFSMSILSSFGPWICIAKASPRLLIRLQAISQSKLVAWFRLWKWGTKLHSDPGELPRESTFGFELYLNTMFMFKAVARDRVKYHFLQVTLGNIKHLPFSEKSSILMIISWKLFYGKSIHKLPFKPGSSNLT